MPDDKKNIGNADRDRVSVEEDYEIDYLVKKFGLLRAVVVKIVREHGPMRLDVERSLERMAGGTMA